MPTYAIGDIQGCYAPLQKLLDHIQFDSKKDTLWFTGDLVNRGPQSLEVLRFIKQLGNQQRTVLGNHDLHCLAVAAGAHPGWKEDTLTSILHAPDRDELLHWLRHQPLIHHDEELNFTMVHAGLAPQWDLETALSLSKEIEIILQSKNTISTDFLHHMYGNLPDHWDPNLTGWDRARCITNYFTRVRYCHPNGNLELNTEKKLIPWFQLPTRASANLNIVFGHWAALAGVTHTPAVFALDTGCVWGYCLTAMRLEDKQRFQVPCVI